ncbi:hypothetical protein MLD38_005866 [Melastoma candidum]|uniref:Uncharacterized protein n=1 Tax=Melastoma candidum TaxID=119954 RepID=A0ACB9RKT3_9MYRT|nr:hypothetical protein MLD38_005866 [Melastoma candidum]
MDDDVVQRVIELERDLNEVLLVVEESGQHCRPDAWSIGIPTKKAVKVMVVVILGEGFEAAAGGGTHRGDRGRGKGKEERLVKQEEGREGNGGSGR